MACILHCNTQDLFKSMAVQIEMDRQEKALLEQQLKKVNNKLNRTHKMLEDKDHIISSLEADLEHLINQMNKLHGGHNIDQPKTYC